MGGFSLWTLAFGLTALALAASIAAHFRTRVAHQKLRERNLLFEVALGNMAQGVIVFDSIGRLVLCNARYMEMYGLSPTAAKPGITVRQLVDLRVAAGTFYKADPEEYIKALMISILDRGSKQGEWELPDGRVINVINQPLHSGGWVSTHKDVTERWLAKREVEATRNFLQTVIENVPTPITVKEVHNRSYILINRAAERFHGLSREQMIGKTAAEIFSPAGAATIAANDRKLLETQSIQHLGDHPVALPSGDCRIARTTRLPVFGEDGKSKYILTVIEDVTEHKRAEARIERLSHYDTLTDLPNRTAFNECFTSVLERAKEVDESFAVLSIDVDRFREINDVFGHAFGDSLLRAIADRLSSAIEGAFLSRMGGDEFAVIVSDAPVPTRAARLADHLLAAVASDFQIEGHRLNIGLSIGIAIYPLDGLDATALLRNADAALSRAKAEGRNSVRFFEAQMDQRLRERRALMLDLRAALDHGEILVHYQPLARIDGEIIGFEALARWRHPTRGQISPGEFVALAEESGLIHRLGEWVLRAACREAASWPHELSIAVNLSPVQLRQGDLPALVHQVLIDTGLSASRLEFEVTESVLIDDLPRALSILRRLKALGVHIAMDDFGTGYSSLSTLQAFPFDKIKIDQSFIANLQHAQVATIVRAVLALARELNLPVVAEGVETKAQLTFLATEGATEVQGYLIGRPLPIEDYAAVVGRAARPGARAASVA